LDQWLIDIVDETVELDDSVGEEFTKEDFVITGQVEVDTSSLGNGSVEVNGLISKFLVFTISDKNVVVVVQVLQLSLKLVLGVVVNKN